MDMDERHRLIKVVAEAWHALSLRTAWVFGVQMKANGTNPAEVTMNVKYSDKAKQSGEEYVLLEQATQSLERLAGPSAASVSAEWDRSHDERGRTRYTLTLSDMSGEVSATFTPNELRSPSRMRSQLLEVWGDLLQRRSHAQMKKLQQLVTEGE